MDAMCMLFEPTSLARRVQNVGNKLRQRADQFCAGDFGFICTGGRGETCKVFENIGRAMKLFTNA